MFEKSWLLYQSVYPWFLLFCLSNSECILDKCVCVVCVVCCVCVCVCLAQTKWDESTNPKDWQNVEDPTFLQDEALICGCLAPLNDILGPPPATNTHPPQYVSHRKKEDPSFLEVRRKLVFRVFCKKNIFIFVFFVSITGVSWPISQVNVFFADIRLEIC